MKTRTPVVLALIIIGISVIIYSGRDEIKYSLETDRIITCLEKEEQDKAKLHPTTKEEEEFQDSYRSALKGNAWAYIVLRMNGLKNRPIENEELKKHWVIEKDGCLTFIQ